MNSIHRIGVTIAGLATVVTVAAAFVVQGYTAAEQAAHTTTTSAVATAAPSVAFSLAPEIVYVNPVPSPQVVHVTQTQPPVAPQAAPAQAAPPVIHVIVPAAGEDTAGSDD